MEHKSKPKSNKTKQPCKHFFEDGFCKYSLDCRYSHEKQSQFIQQSQVIQGLSMIKNINQPKKICNNYLNGNCQYGQKCHFSHTSELLLQAPKLNNLAKPFQKIPNLSEDPNSQVSNTHKSQLFLQPPKPNILAKPFQKVPNISDNVIKKPNSYARNSHSNQLLLQPPEQLNKPNILAEPFQLITNKSKDHVLKKPNSQVITNKNIGFKFDYAYLKELEKNDQAATILKKVQEQLNIKLQLENSKVTKYFPKSNITKVIWSFTNDNYQLEEYTLEQSNKIEKDYNKQLKTVSVQINETIDLIKMQKINTQTQFISYLIRQEMNQKVQKKYQWQYQQNNKKLFNDYTEQQSVEIERNYCKFLQKKLYKDKFTLNINDQSTQIDFWTFTQQNNKQKVKIRRVDQKQDLQTLSNEQVVNAEQITKENINLFITCNSKEIMKQAIEQIKNKLNKLKTTVQIQIPKQISEYILNALNTTIKNMDYSNQTNNKNKILWKNYQNEKNKMISDKKQYHNKTIQPNERFLWHGTRQSDPELIYNDNSGEGFDINYCSDACMWGKGSYFAENASYSDMYAYATQAQANKVYSTSMQRTQKKFLLCLVALGECIKIPSDNTLKLPPSINKDDPKQGRYDSVQGYTQGSNVFILYSMNVRRSYPYFEITYE